MAITEKHLVEGTVQASMFQESDYLSFKLTEEFVDSYKNRKVNWGFPIGGDNYLGELVFFDKYSRKKFDGTKEKWYEVCRRVVEGYYSILKDHCEVNILPWDEHKAQRSAMDAYERMFEFKWLPPGRGLWMMGTEFVHGRRDSAALQNCSFISTKGLDKDPSKPFVRLMEMSMLGIGVGFDTLGAEDGVEIKNRVAPLTKTYVIPDSREGWAKSVKMVLDFYLADGPFPVFDYSQIRPAGAPIKGFGGVASGPEPLKRLHISLHEQFTHRDGDVVSSRDIVDIQNKIGVCVVAGNVRRSAEIALGDLYDSDFVELKDYEKNPERGMWGWTSNNSVKGASAANFDHVIPYIEKNGEPGILMMDLMREYGRLVDEPDNADWRATGTNPCAEQTLESYECCTLVETFPIRHRDMEDFLQTLKHAYLYGKAVTLMPTHWPETNGVMQRNRRIGTSVTGQAEFIEKYGKEELRRWLDEGYREVGRRDRTYSDWLGVRESIKKTSVKPSGTVSLLAGVTPGVHWPTNTIYIRRMRFSVHNPILPYLEDAGFHIEPDVLDPENTLVVSFGTKGPDTRTEKEVSLWEKANLAALHQKWWADNQVSVTLTYLPEEKHQIKQIIEEFKTKLKSMSFLPVTEEGAYAQLPYEAIDLDKYIDITRDIKPVNWDAIYAMREHEDAGGEKYCSNDSCELPFASEDLA